MSSIDPIFPGSITETGSTPFDTIQVQQPTIDTTLWIAFET